MSVIEAAADLAEATRALGTRLRAYEKRPDALKRTRIGRLVANDPRLVDDIYQGRILREGLVKRLALWLSDRDA